MPHVTLPLWVAISLALIIFNESYAETDAAGQEAAEFVAGVRPEKVICLGYNKFTQRLEIRNNLGNLLEELTTGFIGKPIDIAGQEYRISFGKDDMGRLCVIVRPGPAAQQPLMVEVFGKKAVLSPNASWSATLLADNQVQYEPSICGEIYYLEEVIDSAGRTRGHVVSARESAVLAKPARLRQASD